MIERFRSRISFRDELKSLTMFKRHLENFLGLKDKARELGSGCFKQVCLNFDVLVFKAPAQH